MTKISVIMPVFNDEKYVSEAIDSTIKQTLSDIEIICVNDGSTDNSLKILKEYEEKYDYIHVYSQKNQGVSVARNNAMNVAKGDYFAFLDSDDIFIDDDALERLYDVAKKNNANVVAGNLKILNIDGSYSDFTLLKYYNEFEKILPEDYGSPYSFTKAIFKRKFLISNQIYFPLLTKGEDPAFMAEVLSKLDFIYAVPTDVYAYRYIDGSAKYHSYKNYYDQIKHYKLGLEHFIHPKFSKTREDFRFQIFKFIDYMNIKGAKDTIRAIQEVFVEDTELLNQCEEYFYFKYKDIPELSNLVNFKENPNKPRITIIVPFRNDSRFLPELLDNIVNQSFTDFEVLFTNENSTDNSIFIIKEYVEKDSRIKLLYDRNGACGSVRTKAVNDAKGDYILFLNTHNILSNDALEKLYIQSITNESDLVLFKQPDFIQNEQKENYINLLNLNFFENKNYYRFTFDYKSIKKYIFSAEYVIPSNKFFKKSFFKKFSELYYLLDVQYFDLPLNCLSILYSKKISYLDDNLYNLKSNQFEYVIPMNNFELINIIQYLEEKLIDLNLFEELYNEFIYFKFYHLNNILINQKTEENYNLIKRELNLLTKDDLLFKKELFNTIQDISKSNNFEEYNLIVEYNHLNQLNQKKSNTNNHLKNERDKLNTQLSQLRGQKNDLWGKNKSLRLKQKDLSSKNNELSNVKKSYSSKNKSLNSEYVQLKDKNQHYYNHLTHLKKEKNELENSNSWKITEPLRKIKRKIKK